MRILTINSIGNSSVGERCSDDDFNDNSAGDSVDKICWGILMMNSVWDRKNFAGDDLLVATC